MKITQLYLKNYRRLALSKIKEITITVQELIQLIIGSNGSGKSSLLAELLPLPAVPSKYDKGGIKKLWLEHNGSSYILTSEIGSKTAKHSFEKDGILLNDQGTGAIQKELVEREFGLTPDIHGILTGAIRITDLAPIKRREWFSKLSTTDMSYPLKVFKILQSAHRDTVGASKHTEQRLSSETDKLISMKVDDNFQEEVRRLKTEVAQLARHTNDYDITSNQLMTQINQEMQALDQLINDYANKPIKRTNHPSFTSYDELVNYKQKTIEQQIKTDTELKSTINQLNDTNQLVEALMIDRAIDKNGLENKLMVLEEQYGLRALLPEYVRFADELAVIDLDLKAVISPLQHWVSQTDDNLQPEWGKTEQQAKLDRVAALTEHQAKLDAFIKRCHDRIDHFDLSPNTECPKCQHKFKPDFIGLDINTVTAKLEKANLVLKANKQELEVLETNLAKWRRWDEAHQYFCSIMERFPRLQPLWDHISIREVVGRQPSIILDELVQWVDMVTKELSYQQLAKEIADTKALITRLANTKEGQSAEHFCEKANALNQQIELLTADLRVLKTQCADLEEFIRQIDELNRRATQVDQYVTRIVTLYGRWMSVSRNDLIEQQLDRTSRQLVELQDRLNNYNVLSALVNDLTATHEELHTKLAAYKLLCDTLSPVTGLIAEQMSGFVNGIINQMNGILAQLWDYDIEIQSCGIESGGLDYRFPIRINGESSPASDISEGSTGIKDVINFTFQLIVMAYLELTDYPLFMDELGGSFDEVHRDRLIMYIKTLVETNQVSQIFMVNHYSSVLTTFNNVDILVLNDNNVTVPERYNEHVLMG